MPSERSLIPIAGREGPAAPARAPVRDESSGPGATSERGPLTWENWRIWAAEKETALFPSSEGALFSDAHVTGELVDEDMPYRLLNTIAGPENRPSKAIVVRQWWPEADEPQPMTATEATTYHGGSSLEEVAALVSCGLGIRCRAGGLTRSWRWLQDPMGHPYEFDLVTPYLPPSSPRGSVLPEISSASVNLEHLKPFLHAYHSMDASSARAVVRASRMYQQAIWIADDSPNMAWLYLVGAAEVAAVQWRAATTGSPEILQEAFPRIAALIEPYGPDLLSAVAAELAPLVKAQARFVDWVTEFMPAPPDDRPPEWGRVDWVAMTKHLSKIYGHRSQALHDGRPFPQPMCAIPRNPADGAPLERPFGLAAAYNDAVWRQEDTPMFLRTFEYVVRGSIQRWWLSLGREPPEAMDQSATPGTTPTGSSP